MNYAAHYDRLISRTRGRILTGYKERHHVLPKCMGGGNESENIVELTAEEHYVAHQLLVKIHPDVKGLATAAVRMARQCTENKAYGWLRRRHALSASALHTGCKRSPETRAKMAVAKIGKKFSPEHLANLSASQLGNQNSVGHVLSLEVRAKMSDAKRAISPETRVKMSMAHLGKKPSAETRAKMSASMRAYCQSKVVNSRNNTWQA